MAKKPSTPETRALAARNKRRQEEADLERRKALAARQPLLPIAGTSIVPEARYRDVTRYVAGQGLWIVESEKVAWTDPETGYPCIILRQQTGELGGYVGVAPDHALAGWSADALPGSINDGLHQPVTYAAVCQHVQPERASICHVTVAEAAPSRAMHEGKGHGAHSSGRAGARQGEDLAWWFGTIMNGPEDYVPRHRGGSILYERGQIYRGEHFVYLEVTELARKLKVINDSARANTGNTSCTEPGVLPAFKPEDRT
ncbi:hypothetical protein IP81_07400 [Novosphingobium sp. AAP83]|uniref:hypothetical protein n=1 Tax=Novosphingobium sp. AAP83 TaxID=1523425 RepID=UPI0006B8D578|nr:hypothetical protein [Novosphingobium sp. AAP83]KPF91884.1 hypothetical protein IP81_07400 [Novosphingobium sp. AAP83]